LFYFYSYRSPIKFALTFLFISTFDQFTTHINNNTISLPDSCDLSHIPVDTGHKLPDPGQILLSNAGEVNEFQTSLKRSMELREHDRMKKGESGNDLCATFITL
jgi:hypothetical protein